MLTQKHRFHGHGSLRYVYKNAQAVRSRVITIKSIGNPRRKHSRFAVVISKKVLKSAVGRNRVRRRIYEILRREFEHLKPSHDIVVLVFSAEARTMPHDELQALLRQLLLQADLYKND